MSLIRSIRKLYVKSPNVMNTSLLKRRYPVINKTPSISSSMKWPFRPWTKIDIPHATCPFKLHHTDRSSPISVEDLFNTKDEFREDVIDKIQEGLNRTRPCILKMKDYDKSELREIFKEIFEEIEAEYSLKETDNEPNSLIEFVLFMLFVYICVCMGGLVSAGLIEIAYRLGFNDEND